jgi:hypothetical protein
VVTAATAVVPASTPGSTPRRRAAPTSIGVCGAADRLICAYSRHMADVAKTLFR